MGSKNSKNSFKISKDVSSSENNEFYRSFDNLTYWSMTAKQKDYSKETDDENNIDFKSNKSNIENNDNSGKSEK